MSDESIQNNLSSELISIDSDKPKLDKQGRAYATGRRKTSVSRVWIKYGNGNIIVNGKPINEYFLRKIYSTILQDPLNKTEILIRLRFFQLFLEEVCLGRLEL